jgi:hypothetical protein
MRLRHRLLKIGLTSALVLAATAVVQMLQRATTYATFD